MCVEEERKRNGWIGFGDEEPVELLNLKKRRTGLRPCALCSVY